MRSFIRIEDANDQGIAWYTIIVVDSCRDECRLQFTGNSVNRMNELIDARGLSRVDVGEDEEERSEQQKER